MKTGLVAILLFAACTSSNSNGVCGDGVVDPGEQCDDGNNTSGDGCSATCAIESLCGNGHVDTGETCDDGNTTSGDGCSSTCQVESLCGNGHVDAGEQCDDGNTTSGDGCSSTCQLEARCGDGHLDPGEQCDDGNTTSGDGCSSTCQTETRFATTAHWSLKNVAGAAQPCPTGFDTAAVYSQLIDSAGNSVGSPTIDLFTCADFSGTISPLYQGVYRTWIAITNASGSMTYAQSLAVDVDLSTGNKNLVADIYTDGGFFKWAWALQGATSNSALTCAQVAGIQGVELVMTVTNSTQMYSDQYTCTDGSGFTAALPAGSYSVSADAFTSGGSVGTAPALVNQTITAPNNVTDLGTITIPITGQ